MRKNADDLTSPDEITWDSMVEQAARPFENFYTLRGKILHGNLPLEDLSDKDTEEVRTLAHNVITLMASLAKEFSWQNDKEADEWFKNPVYLSFIAEVEKDDDAGLDNL
jgi:hypothetical protein